MSGSGGGVGAAEAGGDASDSDLVFLSDRGLHGGLSPFTLHRTRAGKRYPVAGSRPERACKNHSGVPSARDTKGPTCPFQIPAPARPAAFFQHKEMDCQTPDTLPAPCPAFFSQDSLVASHGPQLGRQHGTLVQTG